MTPTAGQHRYLSNPASRSRLPQSTAGDRPRETVAEFLARGNEIKRLPVAGELPELFWRRRQGAVLAPEWGAV